MSALIRTGDTKEIEKIFTREFIVSLTKEQVEIFMNYLFHRLCKR